MSSSDTAVSVRGLSKSYTIAHQGETHSTLAETLLAKARNPFRQTPKETFWALKDVNFDIKKGEIMGIIGRNGAGKSTLLKVLSRITEPTSGQIDLYGRVGSLLEVGTGFHPELTGRENIYLNGAILGMSKAEIRKQFDAIVDFAGVGKFLDTPVKRYSSGMYVRLAFAVAAHLDPDILIIDEVLAVGDGEFQEKCLGKMKEVSVQGRTVVLVTHNLALLESITNTCVLFEKGIISMRGKTSFVTNKYLAENRSRGCSSHAAYRTRGEGPQRVFGVECLNQSGLAQSSFRPRERISLRFIVESLSLNEWDIAFAIEDEMGTPLFSSHLTDSKEPQSMLGTLAITSLITPNYLRHGRYNISFGIYSRDRHVCHDEIRHFPLLAIEGDTTGIPPADSRWGALFFAFDWNIETKP